MVRCLQRESSIYLQPVLYWLGLRMPKNIKKGVVLCPHNTTPFCVDILYYCFKINALTELLIHQKAGAYVE